jgi:hypothetical protein
MMQETERRLQAEFKSKAEKHKLPYGFVSQLGRTELNQGVAEPDMLEWLDIILPSFEGRVTESTEE